jgi:DNA repair exonuclease SbcCD ATPase subunit
MAVAPSLSPVVPDAMPVGTGPPQYTCGNLNPNQEGIGEDQTDTQEPMDSAYFIGNKSLTFILQALLARHENYVAESEKERHRMMEKIDSLEKLNVELEDSNKISIQENRDLLDQLEALNGAVKDSEAKVQSLTEVLHSTENELQRMNALASRTEQLHFQLARLEEDLAAANSVVVTTREENKAATLRWQEAERTIISLQTQIDQIESDATDERSKHAEVSSNSTFI